MKKLWLILTLALLFTPGCRSRSGHAKSYEFFNKIDKNQKLTQAEKEYAKRYYVYYWKNFIGSDVPQPEQKIAFGPEILDTPIYKKWGLGDSTEFSLEEKVYIFIISQIDDTWRMYEDIDLNNLSEQEMNFLKEYHGKHGPGPIDCRSLLRKEQGKLIPEQEFGFDFGELVTGQKVFDDRGMIFLYRNGFLTNVPLLVDDFEPQVEFGDITNSYACSDGYFVIISRTVGKYIGGDVVYHYEALHCNSEGKVINIESLGEEEKGFFPGEHARIVSKKCELPHVWMWSVSKHLSVFDIMDSTGSFIDDRLYISDFSKQRAQRKMLITTKGQKRMIRNWWLLENANTTKLFVLVAGLVYPSDYPKEQMSYANMLVSTPYLYHWLRCYSFNNEGCSLEYEIPIDNKEYISYEVECAINNNDIIIWQIIKKRPPEVFNASKEEDYVSTLRLATLEDSRSLEWKDCFTGKILYTLGVDTEYGSAARVINRDHPHFCEHSEIIFSFDGKEVHKQTITNKGSFQRAIKYLDKIDTWAVLVNESRLGPHIMYLNKDLEILDKIKIADFPGYYVASYSHLLEMEDELFFVMTYKNRTTRKKELHIRKIPPFESSPLK